MVKGNAKQNDMIWMDIMDNVTQKMLLLQHEKIVHGN